MSGAGLERLVGATVTGGNEGHVNDDSDHNNHNCDQEVIITDTHPDSPYATGMWEAGVNQR